MKTVLQKAALFLVLISQTFANIPLTPDSGLTLENPSSEALKIEPPRNLSEPIPQNPVSYKIAPLSAGLSLLMPGLGQAYNGNYLDANIYILCDVGYITYAAAEAKNAARGLPYDSSRSVATMYQNLGFYSAYAAYRDARSQNGAHLYKHQMPKEDLLDLILAPVNIHVIKKPEVWVGLLASLAGASIISASFNHSELKVPLNHFASLSTRAGPNPLLAFPVGAGEEALFRGYVQSGFMEIMPPASAIALSSIVFGAAHIPNASRWSESYKRQYYSKSIPWITCLGAYMGYLTYKNQSLKESTALHVWYDFTLFLAAAAAESAFVEGSNEKKEPKEYVFGTSFSF